MDDRGTMTVSIRFAILVLLASVVVVGASIAAEAAPGGGASSGSSGGYGDQDRLQTRDTTQDQLRDRNMTQDQDRLLLQNGTGGGAMERERVHVAIQVAQEQAQERLRAMNGAAGGNGSGNGTQVSVAVQARNRYQVSAQVLAQLWNITGNCTGTGVCGLANAVGNSSGVTAQLENRIQTRSAFVRFFAGGDANAAQAMEQETARNRERIQAMNASIATCNCTDELRLALHTQLQTMQQEQDRLQTLAQQQYASKGLLGWLWK